MKPITVLALVLSTAVQAGCASSGSLPSSATGQPSRKADVIAEAELAAAPESDLYTAVERLRPAFLRTQGQSTMQGTSVAINVYVDGGLLGDVNTLHQLVPSEIREVRYLNPSEATMRFGTGNLAGAILVTRK